MKKYRKLYEKETGVRVPDTFEIHHIDHDRKNNDILNLVALPSVLHRRYHFLFPTVELTQQQFILPVSGESCCTMETGLVQVAKFESVWSNCLQWVRYRNWLLKLCSKNESGVHYYLKSEEDGRTNK